MNDHERKLETAQRLRALRERSPYTQEVVADMIGVTLRGYQKMEQTGGVSFRNLRKLAEVFDVPIEAFVAAGSPDARPADIDADQLGRIEQRLEQLTSDMARYFAERDEAITLLNRRLDGIEQRIAHLVGDQVADATVIRVRQALQDVLAAAASTQQAGAEQRTAPGA